MGRRITRLGDSALLVELDGLEAVLGLAAALRQRPVPGQREIVPAATSLLVILDPACSPTDLEACRHELQERKPVVVSGSEAQTVLVDVVYDGDDLQTVGELTGLGVDGVIAAHTEQVWTVAFGGFAPGFGYLVGTDHRLQVPRRAIPRIRVPVGAVGLAGLFSGVYPRESPGGWQLVGRTDAPLWRLDRDPPALLRPGVQVRFRQVAALPEPVTRPDPPTAVASRPDPPTAVASRPDPPAAAPPGGPGLLVVSPGILSLVQDAGRPGFAALGVPGSGAADQGSYRRANRLVGNDDGTAVIETVLGGLRIRAVGAQQVALTGTAAPVTIRSVDGAERRSRADAVVALADGEVLTVRAAAHGLRTYLAVRGGLDLPTTLGSRSTDVLSGLGPEVLSRGVFLPLGAAAAAGFGAGPGSGFDTSEFEVCVDQNEPTVRILSVTGGPHLAYLEPGALSRLTDRTWQVTSQSNRVGIRLDGEPIGRSDDAELPTAPLVPGAVQIPPSGYPVVFLRDHPSTGGYPVIAVLTAAAVDQAAQLRPGDSLRFQRTP